MSLNREADLIANTLGEPNNHELKERIKDLFKDEIAMIINRSSRSGIDRQLIISYDAQVKRVKEYADPINKKGLKEGVIKTMYPVPKSVRVKSDAPFTYVGNLNGKMGYPYRNPNEHQSISLLSSIGGSFSYYLDNDYIVINETNNHFRSSYIRIEGVFESPEEVLSFYSDTDGHDMNLPIPLDMRSMIRVNILKLLGGTNIDDENVKTEEQ